MYTAPTNLWFHGQKVGRWLDFHSLNASEKYSFSTSLSKVFDSLYRIAIIAKRLNASERQLSHLEQKANSTTVGWKKPTIEMSLFGSISRNCCEPRFLLRTFLIYLTIVRIQFGWFAQELLSKRKLCWSPLLCVPFISCSYLLSKACDATNGIRFFVSAPVKHH